MSLKYKGYTTNELEAYGEIILHSIACLGIMVLLVIYVKYFCIQNKTKITSKNKKDQRFNLILLGSLIASFTYIFGTYTFNVIFPIILGNRSQYGCFIRIIWGFAISIQRSTVYSFFLMRLYVTFKGSYFELKKGPVIIILVVIIISQLVGATFPTIFAYLADDFLCANGAYVTQWLLSMVVSNLGDSMWAIVLSCIYIKKLRQLIKMISANDGRKDDKLFNIVNKLNLLAMVTVVSTCLLVIIAFGLMVFPYPLACFDSIINNICVIRKVIQEILLLLY